MAEPTPPWYDDLPASLAEAWALLVRGAADRKHPFHTPAVATIGADGGPHVRTVVLRGASPPARRLRFHTDARSAKATELRARPRIAVHAYDPGGKIQLRLAGTATLHTNDDVANAAWKATKPLSRACYRVATAPGSHASDPVAALAEIGDGDEAGRAAFIAVTVTVVRMEWLYLAAAGHRRALFDWSSGSLRANWLVP
ncbi:pyridoxamine 5'-phosphate oxidase family protein [Elioraea sp.]|uniref:pyridoxamine 5'-phosphate oxidase family protein n=1 Tax=Elioraea sp. TaxID=2185103 RepID=UPI0025BA7377|nr:pyridoxamine 5'-phosphate oxidase family protein [Elioraea sp.]